MAQHGDSLDFVRRHYEKWSTGDDAGALAEDYAEEACNFGHPVGRAVYRQVFEDIYRTFPDLTITVEDMLAQGGDAIVRLQVSGTHLGIAQLPLHGGKLVGVPPTGKQFEVSQIHWHKLRDGLFIDHYAVRDDLTMMSQLGL
jgi:steroid delta-isomerase-like uncharacterized protein